MTNQWYQRPHHGQQQHGHHHGQNPYRVISIHEAVNIALAQVPGQAVKAELEHERRRQVWEVDIRIRNGRKYEVILDAHTGQIISIKVD